MSKKLYFECTSGISGDMTVAALLDLGADREVLARALESLPVKGYRFEIGRVKKAGLDACDFSVILDHAHENHDHDMEYLHGNSPIQDDGEGEEEHRHTHEHRHLADILRIIACGDMTEGARKLAQNIFGILARAEAKAHGVELEEVHFHEVGAVDSIVDIVAAAVCLDNLGIGDVVIPVLHEGRGTVRCQHGILPVPVPATANIVSEAGLKLAIMETEGEFVTPTGAAIAAAVRTEETLPKAFRILKIGLGAGKRSYERPSLLRVMILETQEEERTDRIVKLETNVDDCTGEMLGFVMEKLMEAGARDVHYTPVFMKKNRPAYQLNVICTPELTKQMESILFSETTTIGIRKMEMERAVLDRETRSVSTIYGKAEVKICRGGGVEKWYPEYESIAAICREQGISLAEAYHEVIEAAKRERQKEI